MQTEGAVGGGDDKMIQLMLQTLCFRLSAAFNTDPWFLNYYYARGNSTYNRNKLQERSPFWLIILEKETVEKGDIEMRKERLVTNMVLWMEKLPRLPRIPPIQIISADQGSWILIRQHPKGVMSFFFNFATSLLTPSCS